MIEMVIIKMFVNKAVCEEFVQVSFAFSRNTEKTNKNIYKLWNVRSGNCF